MVRISVFIYKVPLMKRLNPSLLKPQFQQNWDHGIGLRLIEVKPGDAVKQSNGFGSGPKSQRLNGGSPETTPSMLKPRITGAA